MKEYKNISKDLSEEERFLLRQSYKRLIRKLTIDDKLHIESVNSIFEAKYHVNNFCLINPSKKVEAAYNKMINNTDTDGLYE